MDLHPHIQVNMKRAEVSDTFVILGITRSNCLEYVKFNGLIICLVSWLSKKGCLAVHIPRVELCLGSIRS